MEDNPYADMSGNNKKRGRRQGARDASTRRDRLQNEESVETLKRLGVNVVANIDLENNILGGISTVQPAEEPPMRDCMFTENISEGNVSNKRKNRRKNFKKNTRTDGLQIIDQENPISILPSRRNLGHLCEVKYLKNEEVGRMYQSNMATESTNNLVGKDVKGRQSILQLSDKNLTQEISVNHAEKQDGQRINQNKIDIDLSSNLADVNSHKRRKHGKKIKRSAKHKEEIHSMSNLQLPNRDPWDGIDCKLAETECVQFMNRNKLRVVLENDFVESNSMPNLQLSEKTMKEEIDCQIAEKLDVLNMNQDKMDLESANNFTERNVNDKQKWRKKCRNKAKCKNEVEINNSINSLRNLQLSGKSLMQEIDNKVSENVDALNVNQNKLIMESKTLAEGNINNKQKKGKMRMGKAIRKGLVQTTEQGNSVSNLQFSDKSHTEEFDGEVEDVEEFRCMTQNEMNIKSADNIAEGNIVGKVKRKNKESWGKNNWKTQCMGLTNHGSKLQVSDKNNTVPFASNQMAKGHRKFLNALHEVNNVNIIPDDTSTHCSSHVKQEKCSSKDLGEITSIPAAIGRSRKLLILDVNGLLACVVYPPPKDLRGDMNISGRAIFKRPFCHDFLEFCFQNFDVGLWSSRSKKIVDRISDYLLRNLKGKLLFCWDMSHSTQTKFKTLENIHKPLVFKELRKIWGNDGPNFLWKKGDFDESNTLLLDDSPYKALLNPPNSAIFPHSYHYKDYKDNSLGPEGDIRVYLEGLLTCKNTQDYVKQHPFGQNAIDETDVSWKFYSNVLRTMSSVHKISTMSVAQN